MPKIQLTLDTLGWNQVFKLAPLAAPYVDILEAGTLLIKSVGIGIVSRLKSAHPDKAVLADLNSSDVGAYKSAMVFRADAYTVTTQSATTLATITEDHRKADKWKRQAELDMTGVKDPLKRAEEVQLIGVRLVLYHCNIDGEVTRGALWDDRACQTVQKICPLGLAVAIGSGVALEVLPKVCSAPIYTIVVG